MAATGRPKTKGMPSKQKPEIVDKLGEATKCIRCSRVYKCQKGFFSPSYSTIYAANNGFLPVCKDCIDTMLRQYSEMYDGDHAKALRRVCECFDMFYSDALYNSARGTKGIAFLMGSYFSRLNNMQYMRSTGEHKSWDDTIAEDDEIAAKLLEEQVAEKLLEKERLAKEKEELEKNINPNALNNPEDVKEAKNNKKITISDKIIKFFGYGFDDSEYKQLSDDFDDWIKEYECKDKSQKALLKNLCITQLQIQRSIQKGDKIESLMNTFNTLLSGAKLKPTDNRGDLNDPNVILGCWIKDIEKYTPAEYYADKKKYLDFDGFKDYIKRFLYRPLKNLLTGSKDMDSEYNLPPLNERGDDDESTR